MPYSLYRESDGAGDSGPMSLGLRYVGGVIEEKGDFKPEVGFAIRVGSPYARSYLRQDWWQTTYITEILVDEGDYVRFKTLNSVYVWRKF